MNLRITESVNSPRALSKLVFLATPGGVDQSAMTGVLEAGGNAAGVVADSLERAALNRDHRNYLRDWSTGTTSPHDPQAGFNIGNAMQRIKLIYAFADAALVVQSDYGKAWAGAIEQLEQLRLVPVYALPNASKTWHWSLSGKKGALTWPNPTTPEDFSTALADAILRRRSSLDYRTAFLVGRQRKSGRQDPEEQKLPDIAHEPDSSSIPPDKQLFATVRTCSSDAPKTDKEIAEELKVNQCRLRNG
ncbi:MAG TPA: hypothetical protein VLB46_01925 [Pyrinomonadaceae bacterium]|nr:hypothetical protein [Pyrinomonadaceae bacterium]